MTMEIKRLCAVLLVASLLLFTGASVASAGFDDSEPAEYEETNVDTSGNNKLNTYAENIDPLAKPLAETVADNLPYAFALAGVALLMWDGFWTAKDKKNNKLDNSADHKNGLYWSIKMLGLTLIAISIFQAALKSGKFGIL